MKGLTLTALLLLFGLLTHALYAQNASAIVKWEQEHIDLGSLKRGSKIENQYTFTNISDQNIEIDLVSTCECTEATWTQGEIAPGDKGIIQFVFDSSKKDKVEPVDVDVYFLNIDPKTKNPYSSFLNYTYKFSD